MTRGDTTVTMTPDVRAGWEARPPLLPPRWQILGGLGRGGQAEVWLAVDQHLAQQVAVKVFSAEMSPLQRERMRREVRLGRTLQHPGLVRVFELVEAGERTAVVMEFVPGGSLAAAVADRPLPRERVVAVADEVLTVLDYLHRQGVVHRDIKPSNLLIDGEGRVRVADLGLARHWEGGQTLTESHTTLGTPRYMSPEQVRGERPLPQSDLYSLGATLFHLLTGRPPFDHESTFEVARLHLSAPVPDPRRWRPDCPHWLARFVMRLLEKRPGDRFVSAREALEVLHSRSAASLPARRRRAAVAMLAAAVLLTVGWGALVHGGRVPAGARVIGGNKVVASDDEDRPLWERSFSVGVKDAVLVPGKGRPPRLYVATTSPRSASPGSGSIFELDARGKERASFSVADHLAAYFPDLGRFASAERLLGEDVDGDGEAELTWIAKHFFYPSAVGVWWRRPRPLAEHVFINSGHLTSVAWADLDDDGRREAVMAGFNNRLGYQGVVAVVELGGGEM
ncbi:MAG: protein kinase, partial [Acidobacteriota bacterium]